MIPPPRPDGAEASPPMSTRLKGTLAQRSLELDQSGSTSMRGMSQLSSSSRSVPPMASRLRSVVPNGISRGIEDSLCKYKLVDFEADLQECVVTPTVNINKHKKPDNGLESERLKKVYAFVRTDLEELWCRWNTEIERNLKERLMESVSKQEQLLQASMSKQEELLKGLLAQVADMAPSVEKDTDAVLAPLSQSRDSCQSFMAVGTKGPKLQQVEDEPKLQQVEAEPEPLECSPESDDPDFPVAPRTSRTSMSGKKVRHSVTDALRADLQTRRANTTELEEGMAAVEDEEASQKPQPTVVQRVLEVCRSRQFEHVSCAITGLNMLFYGIEVEVQARRHSSDKDAVMMVSMAFFTIYFTVELLFRLAATGHDFYRGTDRKWNALDTFVVVASLLEFFMTIFAGPRLYFRFTQIARIMRVFRIIRSFRFLRSLKMLLVSIASTMLQLVWTIALLTGMLYICAIVFTESTTAYSVLFHENLERDDWPCDEPSEQSSDFCQLQSLYGRLGFSMMTLFMAITGGMDWRDSFEPLSQIGWMTQTLFIAYLTFASLAVLNVVTAIFCQSAMDGAANEQDIKEQFCEERRETLIKHLLSLFKVIDEDGSGELTASEFENGLLDPKIQIFLETLELSVQEARLLFRLLEGGDQKISIRDFVDGCMNLRGNARNFDVALLRYECQCLLDRVNSFLEAADPDENSLVGCTELKEPLPRKEKRSKDDVSSEEVKEVSWRDMVK